MPTSVQTLSLALSFSLLRNMGGEGNALDYTRVWRRSLIAATAAQALAPHAEGATGEDLRRASLQSHHRGLRTNFQLSRRCDCKR